MKRLLASMDSAQVGLARSVLEAAGIACEVRNEIVSQAFPTVPFAPELWVQGSIQRLGSTMRWSQQTPALLLGRLQQFHTHGSGDAPPRRLWLSLIR